MNGKALETARKKLGLTQVEAAKRLGVSQAYFSLFEKGKRPLTKKIARKAVHLFEMPPTDLPIEKELENVRPATNEKFVGQLAAYKYPGYSHVKASGLKNPVEVLISALSTDNLEARLVEALPWLLLRFPEIKWNNLVDAAKLRDLQNRLGFLTSIALKLAEKSGDTEKAAEFKRRLNELEKSRLVKEDTLCCQNMTKAEKRWILQNRSAEAEHWNIISDLLAEHLSYVK
jgi:transcriptional regulator with XRE-family HTH domain